MATTAVSTGLTVYKDSQIARTLGSRGLTAAVPVSSLLLFGLRDSITIFGSFNLPPLLAPAMPSLPFRGADHEITDREEERQRLMVAQLCLPVAAQLLTTPVHLFGLDLYNRNYALGARQRLGRVMRDYWLAVPVRMVRIVPAFGLGSITNMRVRTALLSNWV